MQIQHRLAPFIFLGLQMTAFNGGPHFKLTEAFSLTVAAADQLKSLIQGVARPSRRPQRVKAS
jgi:predicted 3-demethylubiquinone-9 3-methyltransferase (glyoxalase superfamily)